MIEKGKINARQFHVLVILFTLGGSILFEPSILAAAAKQNAWISAIIGIVVGIALVYLFILIGSRHPEKNLFEYSEHILGKWAGKIVSLLFLFFFFVLAADILRNIGDFITAQIMPETPIELIHIAFLSIVVLGTRYGLEAMARTGEILIPWVFLFLMIIFVTLLPQFQINNLQPIFEGGIKPILIGSTYVISFPYLDSVVLLMLFPYVSQKKAVKKSFLKGAVFGGFIIVLITIFCIAVLGAEFTADNESPSYALAKQINIANFFQRVEAMVAGVWFITIYFKLAISFYASALGFAHILKLKEYRPLTLPLGMILLILSIITSPNMAEYHYFLQQYWFPYSLTTVFFLPLLLLIVDLIRKNRNKRECTGNQNQ